MTTAQAAILVARVLLVVLALGIVNGASAWLFWAVLPRFVAGFTP